MTNGSRVRKLEMQMPRVWDREQLVNGNSQSMSRVEDGDSVAMANDSTRNSPMSDVFIHISSAPLIGNSQK